MIIRDFYRQFTVLTMIAALHNLVRYVLGHSRLSQASIRPFSQKSRLNREGPSSRCLSVGG